MKDGKWKKQGKNLARRNRTDCLGGDPLSGRTVQFELGRNRRNSGGVRPSLKQELQTQRGASVIFEVPRTVGGFSWRF